MTVGEALTERQTHVLEIAAGTMEENNRRPIDYSGALAQFNDVLTQATDLEERPAWWVRPLDQLRADESDGGAAAKERSDNGESVHPSSACRADYRDQSSDSAQRWADGGAFYAARSVAPKIPERLGGKRDRWSARLPILHPAVFSVRHIPAAFSIDAKGPTMAR